MSFDKPQYEYEVWLLPYKPLDKEKSNEQRDSKNRVILTKEMLYKQENLDECVHVKEMKIIEGPSSATNFIKDPGPSSSSDSEPSSTTTKDIHFPTVLKTSFIAGPIQYSQSGVEPYSAIENRNSPSPVRKGKKQNKKGQSYKNGQGQVKVNKVQKKMEKALVTPVTLSKAESMMLKMGWSGGALGRTGEGITEPIAPNFYYALSTKGFGQEPPSKKPKQKSNKQFKQNSKNPKKMLKIAQSIKNPKKTLKTEMHQQKFAQNKVFKDNVLRYILQFVKNESEIAIVFDGTLKDKYRKSVHKVVEDIRNMSGLEVKDKTMNCQWDRLMLMDIVNANRYVLQSQSEGMPPNRCLCLFKEPPPFMFVVTHYKLNDIENEFVVKHDEVPYYQHYRKFPKKKKKLDMKIKIENALVKNAQTVIAKKLNIEKDYEKDKKKHDIYTVRNTVTESNKKDDDFDGEDANDSESHDETEPTNEQDDVSEIGSLNIDDCVVIDEDDETVNEEVKQLEISNEIKTIKETDEQNIDIVENTAAKTSRITKDDEITQMYCRAIAWVSRALKGVGNDKSEGKHFKDMPLVNNNNDYTMTSAIKSNTEDEIKVNEIQTKIDITDKEPMSIIIEKSNRKEFLRYNLNMCFSDFITGTAYKEFKFLGHFDKEEFEVLNEFLRDLFLVKKGGEPLDNEFMDVWKEVVRLRLGLSYKKGLHQGIVIYKTS